MEEQANSVKRIVSGGLAALFLALLIAALALFGIINMTIGHVLMFMAALVGGLLICTEIIPSKPPKHKVIFTALLWVLLLIADIWVVRQKHSEGESQAQRPSVDARGATIPSNPVFVPRSVPALSPPVHDDPVGRLSKLGWSVKRDQRQLLVFEVANLPLPNMVDSAIYFADLRDPFRLHFQNVPSLAGLERLAKIERCEEIEIDGSDLYDISALSGFVSLKRLIISQVPLNTHADLDSSPLAKLTHLEALSLYRSRFTDLTPVRGMVNLKSISVGGSLISDLTPLAQLHSLTAADVRDSQVTDITPLAQSKGLRELTIDGRQLATLGSLSPGALRSLSLIEQGPVDLAPIGLLTHLETLFIWMPPALDLGFLSKLTNLTNLQIMGAGLGSQVSQVNFICSGGNLKKLSLAELQISSLVFLAGCSRLTEINISQLPISSINELAQIPTLNKVSLMDVRILEIAPLLSLPNLRTLNILRVPARADEISLLEQKGVKVSNP